jgi:hypothetical protein
MAVDVVKYRRVFTAEVAEVAEKTQSIVERRGGEEDRRRVFTAEVAEVAEKNAEYSREEGRGLRQEGGRWLRYICEF